MALGRGITLTPGLTNANILNWTWPKQSPAGELDPYCEDQESKTVNIQIDRDIGAPVDPLTDTVETAFVTIRSSAGNLTQIVEVDIQNGTLVTVVGQVVNITGNYPTLRGFTHPSINVRAVLGFDGGRPSAGVTSIPRRTVFIGVVDVGAASAIIPIPRFAVAAFMRNANIATPFATMAQFRSAAVGNVINIIPIGKLDQDSAPVANGALFFQIVNAAPFALTSLSVVFYLGI